MAPLDLLAELFFGPVLIRPSVFVTTLACLVLGHIVASSLADVSILARKKQCRLCRSPAVVKLTVVHRSEPLISRVCLPSSRSAVSYGVCL